jgi:CRP-like cAMP-binding protein
MRLTRGAKVAAAAVPRIARQIAGRLPGLSAAQAEKLAGISEERSYEAGEAIFKSGDIAKEVYLLLRGRVALRAKFGTYVDTITLASVAPMEFFGWSSLMEKQAKTAQADVVEDAKVLVFDAKELMALCDADPTLGYVVMRCLVDTVGQRLVTTRRWVLDLLT